MVSTTLQYLARDKLYETEKPYSAEFELDEHEDVKRSNYILTEQKVTVHAIQSTNKFDMDTNGFCIIRAETSLTADNALHQPETVEETYLREVKAILHNHFPEYKRIEPFEFVVRKRDERFPSNQLAIVTHEQPACLAHSDFSAKGAWLQLEASFPREAGYFEGKEFDMINVWRPLFGPNNDWPLALCDFTTVDVEHDIVVADLLHSSRVGENQLLHPSTRHRWYYVEDQQPADLMVFRNIDSTGRRASMEYHKS